LRGNAPARIANFAHPVGARADAPGLTAEDDGPVTCDGLIIDLADRHNDGIDVVLLWERRTEHFWVTVTHGRSGRTARIDATPANVLDVFRHPLGYAPGGS
jgi:hypothetical protein